MKTKKIFLVRHGQTDYNLKGVAQGSGIDAPINATGRQQAKAFFQTYKDIPFDKVYTSVLQRSIQSVQSFIALDIPHEKLLGLNEISWGNREGKSFVSGEDHYKVVTNAWKNGDVDAKIEAGESPLEVQKRQKIALTHILSQEKEDTILICMHGRAMRILLCLMLNYNLKHMDLFSHSNLGVYKINYNGSSFSIESANDVRHLNASF